jgi:hypothetical protein
MPAVELKHERQVPVNADQILKIEHVMAVPLGTKRAFEQHRCHLYASLLAAQASGTASTRRVFPTEAYRFPPAKLRDHF